MGVAAFTMQLHGFKLLHQLTRLLGRVCTTGSAQPKELNHVEAAFAQFQAANKTALSFEFFCQLTLSQSGSGPQGHKHFVDAFALTGMDGFFHARMLRALFACFQNASKQPLPPMSRRNESFSELLVKLPWAVSAGLGVFTFAILRWGLRALWRDNILFQPLTTLAANLAPLAGLLFGAMACLSVWFSKRRQALVDQQTSLESLREVDWKDFEFLVSEAYRRQGYQVDYSLGKGADGGVDLVLRKGGRTSLVQCKQRKIFSVGVPVIREQFGIMKAERADEAIIVTSGKFTREAVIFARGKPIQLVDGPRLFELVKQAQGGARNSNTQAHSANPPAVSPLCPNCGNKMALKTARHGKNAGNKFWGCMDYPSCKGTRDA